MRTRKEYIEVVLMVLHRVGHDATQHNTLGEAGISSLDVIDLEFELEKEFGVKVDVDKDQLHHETTVWSYAWLVKKAVEGQGGPKWWPEEIA